MMFGGMHMLGRMFLFAMLFKFFWVILLIIGAVWLLGGGSRRTVNPPFFPPSNAALDLLDQRYARGEISREVYTQQRQDLSAGR